MIKSIIAMMLFAGLAGAQDMHQRMWDWMALPSGDPAWMTGQVAYYPLDGDGTDAVGTHDATASGSPTFGTDYGIKGQGVSLNGSSQWLTCGDLDLYDGVGFTISLWVNRQSRNTVDMLLSKWRDSAAADYDSYLNINSDVAVVKYEHPSYPEISLGGGTITVGVWKHVMATYDKTNLNLYVDSVLVGTKDATGNYPPVTDATTYIGAQGPFQQHPLHGYIDEIRCWNRGLSSNEVADVYNYDAP